MPTKPANRRFAPRLAILGLLLVATTTIGEIPALESLTPVGTAEAAPCPSTRDCAWDLAMDELAKIVGVCILVDCWKLE